MFLAKVVSVLILETSVLFMDNLVLYLLLIFSVLFGGGFDF